MPQANTTNIFCFFWHFPINFTIVEFGLGLVWSGGGRYHSGFFMQVRHDTTYASNGNKYFFLIFLVISNLQWPFSTHLFFFLHIPLLMKVCEFSAFGLELAQPFLNTVPAVKNMENK